MTDLVQLSLDDLTPAREARDEGLARVEQAGDDWDRRRIDQAITHLASQGRPFSANDARPLVEGVRSALIGARFLAAAKRGQIVKLGYVTSTDPGTHSHPIAMWVAA